MESHVYAQHKKANLVGLIVLIALVGSGWFLARSEPLPNVKILAAIACLKFTIIYFLFMEVYRSHFFWILAGAIFSISIGGLLAFQG